MGLRTYTTGHSRSSVPVASWLVMNFQRYYHFLHSQCLMILMLRSHILGRSRFLLRDFRNAPLECHSADVTGHRVMSRARIIASPPKREFAQWRKS